MRFFSAKANTTEKVFRIGVATWGFLIFALGTLAILAITQSNSAFFGPLIFIGPALIALTIALFFFALVRIVVTLFKKEYSLTVGYVVYAGLVGLLIIPMVAALYDRHRLIGSFF